jgi:pilus assembly protein Flp/PilA
MMRAKGSGSAEIGREIQCGRGFGMSKLILKAYVKCQSLMLMEEGQDLVEYALLCTMISLALITGMKGIASTISSVFSNISSSLS